MGLREQAAADLQAITEDEDTGFGWPIRVTAPDGTAYDIVGLSNDVHTTIDPDTGQAITGRNASVAISQRTLAREGLEFPRSIADSGSKPWRVQFRDLQGTLHFFKVQEALPDRALGAVVCLLEAYTPPADELED